MQPSSGEPSDEKGENHAKKKTIRYREQNAVKVREYKDKIAKIPGSRLAYIDECGVDSYVYREYGWSPRGEKIYDAVSRRKYQRVGIVAARDNRAIAVRRLDGQPIVRSVV